NSDTGNPLVPTANDLCSPYGVAVDTGGDLYVADYGNSRVLEYSKPLTTHKTTADAVFGQGEDFTSSYCNFGGEYASASSLCTPYGVTVDSSGNLYVADYGNSRVLEYNTPLTTHKTTADAVFGQGEDFTSSQCNFGGTSASQESLCSPSGAAVDSRGNLYVADTSNNRVLEYN